MRRITTLTLMCTMPFSNSFRMLINQHGYRSVSSFLHHRPYCPFNYKTIEFNPTLINRRICFLSPNPNSIKDTYEYIPYQTLQQRPKRSFSNPPFRVPDKVNIPADKIDISFTRSSGAGGQNVNKLSTKVELRFHVMSADWLPLEVRERVTEKFSKSRMNKEGYFVVTAQEHRTQAQNRTTAMQKLNDLIMQAYPRPFKRKVRKGVSKRAKERNKEDKRKKGQVKALRGRVDY